MMCVLHSYVFCLEIREKIKNVFAFYDVASSVEFNNCIACVFRFC